MSQSQLQAMLRDPVTGAAVDSIDEQRVTFVGGRQYPIHRGAPVIFHPDSLFTASQVQDQVPTTQDRSYRDERSIKNRIRKRTLPSLARPSSPGSAGYSSLAARRRKSAGLVIGSGDRVQQYRQDFSSLSEVVCSDVHTQFGCDLVFDAHWIPVADGTFSVVLAAEVLEHTMRPWQVASELERVAANDALIQIEVPFVFPLHGAPYDFFRFTVFGLRSLFRSCAIDDLRLAGGFSASAIALSESVVNLTDRRLPRAALMAGSRLAFGWLKMLDRSPTADWRSAALPRSLSMTFRCDGAARSDRDLLNDVEHWLSTSVRRPWIS